MKLFKFLESTYITTNIDLQVEHSQSKQAKTQAVQDLINLQRKLLKWAWWVLLPVKYALVKATLLPAPKHPDVLMDELRKKAAEADAVKKEAMQKARELNQEEKLHILKPLNTDESQVLS